VSQLDPFPPTPPGGGSDIPPDSPLHRSSAPTARRNGGIAGAIVTALAAVVAYGKYALLIIFKIPALTTLVSLAISFGSYAVFWGPWYAFSLVLMILVHEMGHVVEIRRQGMQATAPVFIPFLGAAIFQRSHPTDAMKQAQIGIAGPIAGTIGATAAFLLFQSTHIPVLLLMAWIGFYINLFNLVPIWMLDGAWIMGPTTRGVRLVASLVVLAVAYLFHAAVSPLLVVIGLVGVATAVLGRNKESNPYFASVPASARAAIGVAWLVMVLYLGVASAQAYVWLNALAR